MSKFFQHIVHLISSDRTVLLKNSLVEPDPEFLILVPTGSLQGRVHLNLENYKMSRFPSLTSMAFPLTISLSPISPDRNLSTSTSGSKALIQAASGRFSFHSSYCLGGQFRWQSNVLTAILGGRMCMFPCTVSTSLHLARAPPPPMAPPRNKYRTCRYLSSSHVYDKFTGIYQVDRYLSNLQVCAKLTGI